MANRQWNQSLLKAGACGYLLKDCAFEELIPAIYSAFDNQTYLGSGLEIDAAPISVSRDI